METKNKRRKIKVAPYDSAVYLKTGADIKNYLEAVFEEPRDRQNSLLSRRLTAYKRYICVLIPIITG